MINENEIAEVVNVVRMKDDLQKLLDTLKADYVKNLTIHSTAGNLKSFPLFQGIVLISCPNSGSIENLPVEFEGETFTLQELAQIGRKGHQMLVINVSSFPQAIKSVLKAIQDSGMGLNPQQDGTTLFIPIPK